MAGTNLSFPYDEEIFNYTWENTPDLILTSMLESGAFVNDSVIAGLISSGSNFFATPFYDVLSGTEDVYNGVDNFTGASLTGGNYTGVVYGRMSKWTAKSFISDFNSGADPMGQIIAGVAKFWMKARQTRLIAILEALFGITGDSDWDLHTTDIASAGVAQVEQAIVTSGSSSAGDFTLTVTADGMTNSPKAVVVTTVGTEDVDATAVLARTALSNDADVSAFFNVGGTSGDLELTAKTIAPMDSTLDIAFADTDTTNVVISASTDITVYVSVLDANLIGATTVNDAGVKANGDNASAYSLVIMHSQVANKLANLQLLEYSKYTDASGIMRSLPIGTINGKAVIVNDSVPTSVSPVAGALEYATYLLGLGSIRYAKAPVDIPSEMDRDPDTNGGLDMVYTRIRECMAPNGFSFKGDVATDVGVPDAVLTVSASWERKMPAKSIFMAKIITNG